MRRLIKTSGFTLIEVVIVILMLGIIATVATLRLQESLDTAYMEQTKQELDQLAHAIVGNPEVFADGARTNFGYVGDVGSLPPNLDALVSNPGGFATWDGPYIQNGVNPDDFKKDAWETFYIYADTLLRSTGSGNDIDKIFAGSTADLLSNRVSGTVLDANRQTPPGSYTDSVTVVLSFPDGSGGITSSSTFLNRHGGFAFTAVPIGNHQLKVIYSPVADTVTYAVSVCPGRDVRMDIVFPSDLW